MNSINPAAPHHMPWFITAPGETDGLFIAMIVFLIVVVLIIGNLYFKLHALPEHLAHRANKVQLEIVSVLALLALFTHNHIFWIAGLLLALVQFPDFSTPISSITQSLHKLAQGGSPSMPQPQGNAEQTPDEGLSPLAPDSKLRAELPSPAKDLGDA
ncbi:hypothetical protein ACWGS9_05600 [Bradyrhizobium sp. Arg314]